MPATPAARGPPQQARSPAIPGQLRIFRSAA
jgi:hypothetical protein